MKKKHLKNLEKLADFLEKEITDKQFDIRYVLKSEVNSAPDVDDIVPECGTIGCAIGWSTALFYRQSLKHHDWGHYTESMFGGELGEPVTSYMFSDSWDWVPRQGTRLATVKRIREIVAQKGKLTQKQVNILTSKLFMYASDIPPELIMAK